MEVIRTVFRTDNPPLEKPDSVSSYFLLLFDNNNNNINNNNNNNNNNNIIFIQGKSLQCRNTVINGVPVKLRWFKLRLILRREENWRTRRKTLEARERPTTTTLLT